MKVLVLIVLSVFLLCAFAEDHLQLVERQFTQWADSENKRYQTQEEYDMRLEIFTNNLELVDQYNSLEGKQIYGITKFMDLSQEEFRAKYLLPKGKIQPQKEKHVTEFEFLPTDIPTRFDWRDKGAVTKVYDQGQCGSCWAFSATEAIESQWFLAGHSLVSLSPQQIVDCDKGRGDEGCNGGDTPTAYEYVISAGGMDSEKDYPYTAEDDKCAFKSESVAAKISSWTYVTKNKNETEMQQKLLEKGPLSICVDAQPWQFYVGGVVSSFCGNDLDHCVLITGYDDAYVDWVGQTIKIWKIRNSWGSDWGESGYIYVERDYDLCGVADEATLPIV